MRDYLRITLPDSEIRLYPNDIIKLGRFERIKWLVSYGWYSWGGNRPVCGWYLIDINNPTRIKPLQLPDLDDVYHIRHARRCREEEVDSE